MGGFRAIALPSVDEESLRQLFESELDLQWEYAAHVTATISLRSAIRSTGVLAHSILTLIDLIVIPELDDRGELSPFPAASTFVDARDSYSAEEEEWGSASRRITLRHALDFDRLLRRQLDEREDSTSPDVLDLLRSERRTFRRTVQALNAAGLIAEDLDGDSTRMGEVARLAQRSWAAIEAESRWLLAYRDALWRPAAGAAGTSSEVLRAAFGGAGTTERRMTVVYHGFYFFTPPQWALFQLIKELPWVDQIFIVHDDGTSPEFEVWRRFFAEKWEMPSPEGQIPGREISKPARLLRRAIGGATLEAAVPEDGLSIIECRSPLEFSLHWKKQQGRSGPDEKRPALYAAGEKTIEMMIEPDKGGDLEHSSFLGSPVGAFLVAITRCIEVNSRGVEATINTESMVDVASSGFVGGDVGGQSLASLYLRAAPFFDGCEDPQDWIERSSALLRLIALTEDHGSRWASRYEEQSKGAGNPLHLAPWAALSFDEASAVKELVHSVANRVVDLAAHKSGEIQTLARIMRPSSDVASSQVNNRMLEEVENRVTRLFSSGDEDVDLEGLIEVVQVILGGVTVDEVDSIGESRHDPGARVRPLRSLDALGFARTTVDVELANISARSFPAPSPAVGWPFLIDDIRMTAPRIPRELLVERARSSPLGDLYLLWLATDGVDSKNRLTISWISEMPDGDTGPSGIIQLLLAPPERFDRIRGYVGGLDPTQEGESTLLEVVAEPIAPEQPQQLTVLSEHLPDKLGLVPLASASACPRRFALQWALGTSPSYRDSHEQANLYGNLRNALWRLTEWRREEAEQLVDDFWRHLTDGQRSDSLSGSRVLARTSGSSDPLWIYTLKGSKSHEDNQPLSLAYRTAIRMKPFENSDVEAPDEAWLPSGPSSAEACTMCPVQSRCSIRPTKFDDET